MAMVGQSRDYKLVSRKWSYCVDRLRCPNNGSESHDCCLDCAARSLGGYQAAICVEHWRWRGVRRLIRLIEESACARGGKGVGSDMASTVAEGDTVAR